MKKLRSKLLSCLLAFVVCLGCLPAPAYAAPMEKTAKEEFTLGNQVTGYAVTFNSKDTMSSRTIATYGASTPVPTEAEAKAKMMALKSKYPEGTPYTNDNYYDWKGGYYNRGNGCAGFAFMLSDAAFGDLPAAMISTNITINKVHVGDILRLNNDSHSVIITDVYADHVVIAEGNYNYSVHWGRTLTAAEVAKADYVLTRYPAGTFGDSYELTFDANGGTGGPTGQYIYEGCSLTSMVPSREFYEFVGWATSPGATTAQYYPGDKMTLNGPKQLYAIWRKYTSYPELADKLNTSIPLTITAEKPDLYYQFTAPKTCEYVFESQGSLDTKIDLYSSDGTLLDQADDIYSDGITNYNFSLCYSMTAGKTYLIKLSSFNGYGSFTMTIKENGATVDPVDPVDPDDPEPQTYKVTFDYNDNSPSTKQNLYVKEGYLTLSVNARRDGYKLLGWSLSPETDEPDYTVGESAYISSDTTYYAVWRKVNVASVNNFYNVNVNASNPYVYYEFTAPKTDTYIFASQSDTYGCDPCLDVYDTLENEIDSADDLYHEFIDVRDSNFEYRQYMEAGETILLCVHLYNIDESGSFLFLIRPESEVPDAPGIKSVANASNGVKVSWNSVDNASYYLIFYGLATEDVYTDVALSYGTSCTVTGLTSGKTYDFAVMALDSYDCFNDISGYLSMRYFKNMTITKVANVSSGMKLTWDKMSGATGYIIYRKTSSASYERIAKITDKNTLSYIDTEVKSKNGTKYTYKIKPYYKSYVGTGTEKSYYRLTNTNVSTLTNPSAGKMKVTWTKNSKVTAYQIQYSKSSTFASGNKTVTVTGAANVAKTISSLTRGSTYYVRIRTYKTVSGTKYYSAWGTKKSIKITR